VKAPASPGANLFLLGVPAMRGKSRASLDLIRAAYEILKSIQPASIRAVCYQLSTAG
jgi:hypothetical protein